MIFLIRRLTRVGLRRGVFGGSRAWLAIGIAGAALQLLRRMSQEPDEVFVLDDVKPGDRFEVAFLPRTK